MTSNGYTHHLLNAGIATPFLYFALLFVAGAFYPEFSHIRQVASDLGADGASYGGAIAFNIGLILVGLSGIAGSAGVFMGLRRAGGNVILATLTGATFAAPLLNLVLSGLWPLPHPWHSNAFLVLSGYFAPALAACALWRVNSTRAVRLLLAMCFGLILVVLNGLGGLGAPEIAGLRWRLIAFLVFGGLALMSWTLRTSVQQPETDDLS